MHGDNAWLRLVSGRCIATFPAEVRLRPVNRSPWRCIPSEGSSYGWSINGRSLDTAYANQTSLVSLRLLCRKWWLLNKLGEQMHDDFIHSWWQCLPSGSSTVRLVNRLPWPCIPSGNSTSAGESFTVTMHSQRRVDSAGQ